MHPSPTAPEEPITAETLSSMSRQLLGGVFRQPDLDAVATLLNGLEQEMVAFHRVNFGELEPVTIYSPS
jgi:hypothetical protein